ncbi:xyloglucan-specific endo-beta-1,4-glucanase A [Microdochium trichocladiopsis]|uniref:Xyloglucan-specific endo-beta-1,4-glucanase A n=1 Tax=Microdochium trichocladiopsis TaxID=1682393 RepID=A0A9P8YIY1_9PEZI|nr:xyloglucan-specific endo-beta-1,4-glucanase A [Microdochium trichocladiopsis]KAH7039879.1 xyloglucan-specific endo-beta-1,4-glucanase A [Microdochium trichocladiopsis]
MKTSAILTALAGLTTTLPSLATATPTPTTLDKRATTFCGDWDSAATGGYTVYNNLWGKGAATSGSQCTTLTGVSSGNLQWSTSWSWQGGNYNVKSYANAVLTSAAPKQLSAIQSIPSTWQWSYTGSGMVANVAYDLFTSSVPSASSTPQYEIMIWLAALGGAGPISSTGSPIATPTIAGIRWNLFKGPNGSMTVFSFVAASGQQPNFSGDLNGFVRYLTSSQGLPASQYLNSLGAGTEPFVGSNAVFRTTAYRAAVN